jgi:hypothetical protein
MGMDISGLNPTITGDKPVFPSNWDELSEKAQSFYNELRSDWDRNNPGYYLRFNVWTWRPIHFACIACNDLDPDLDIDIDDINKWAFNSGDGLKDQHTCNKLADSLEMLRDGMAEDNVQEFGFNLGMWNRMDGHFVEDEEQEKIDELYPKSSAKVMTNLPITIDGVEYKPSHVAKMEDLDEFILFLRHCGGFEIY